MGKAMESFEPGQLRWRCRRGMRELDAALCAYLDHHYKDADDAEKQIFHELLALPDPELMQYVVKRRGSDPTTAEQNENTRPEGNGSDGEKFEVVLQKIRATLTP